MELNVFNGMKTKATVKNSYQSILQAENDLSEMKNRMKTDLANILLDFSVAENNLKAAQKNVVEAMENLRITKLAHDQGKASTTDILNSIYYLSRAKQSRIDAAGDLAETGYKMTRMIEGFKY